MDVVNKVFIVLVTTIDMVVGKRSFILGGYTSLELAELSRESYLEEFPEDYVLIEEVEIEG